MFEDEDDQTYLSTEESTQSSYVDVKADDIKLNQMRKHQQNRGAATSRFMNRMNGLQTYEEMLRDHATKRMQEGIEKILSLHTPYELSSICGALGLPVQQKASGSIAAIVQYTNDGKTISEEKVNKLVQSFWEGALFEYLRCIGHPVHNMLLDPKNTVMTIWQKGGLLDNSRSFTPHFIAREVRKRYEWVRADDVKERLEKLRVLQEKAKKSEHDIVTEHDYTHILNYFHQMSELRKQENLTRDYFIGELEIARARVDSNQETMKMCHKDLEECELQFILVADSLNEKLAHCESLCDSQSKQLLDMEEQLQRMHNIVDSYHEAELNRQECGGGAVAALELREAESCCLSIQKLHKKLQKYKKLRDSADNKLRDRASGHIDEIWRLEKHVRALEASLAVHTHEGSHWETRALKAERELKFCVKKMNKMKWLAQFGAQESWAASLRHSAKTADMESRRRKVEPLVLAGILHSNPTVVELCYTLIRVMRLATEEQVAATLEREVMARADVFSTKLRKFEKMKNKKGQASAVTMAAASGKLLKKAKAAKAAVVEDASQAAATSNNNTTTAPAKTEEPRAQTPKKKKSAKSDSETDENPSSTKAKPGTAGSGSPKKVVTKAKK